MAISSWRPSLTKEEATPERLLELLRLYWNHSKMAPISRWTSARAKTVAACATVLGVPRRAVQG